MDNRTLLQNCRAGNAHAWETLVERFSRLVYSIPRRFGLSSSDADDVHQAVFLSLFRHLDRLEDAASLPAWLITSAHRETWRVGKRAGKYPTLDVQMTDVSAPDPQLAAAWERQHLVRQALESLGGACEQLLRALFLDTGEESYEAIAERLGMAIGSIGPTRARCLRKLEAILRQSGFKPETELADG